MDLVGIVALACVVPVASADDLVLGRPTCRVDNPSFILVAAAAALVVVAGVGGKGLRDVIADQIPEVLRDAQNYASAAPLPAVHARMSFSLISTSNVLAAFRIPIIAIFAGRMVTPNLGFRYRRSTIPESRTGDRRSDRPPFLGACRRARRHHVQDRDRGRCWISFGRGPFPDRASRAR